VIPGVIIIGHTAPNMEAATVW